MQSQAFAGKHGFDARFAESAYAKGDGRPATNAGSRGQVCASCRQMLREQMQGKIALEEHFAIEATLADSQVFGAHVWNELGPRLTDFQDKRLRLMDASGVEIMILSLNAPAVQAIWDVG